MIKNSNRFILINALASLIILVNACSSGSSSNNSISSDPALIAKGQVAFSQNCSGCHNFRQDGIGPQLGGLTSVVSADWIKNFVKNPKTVIESGDQRAQTLFEKYNTVMPSFAYVPEEDITGIIAFMNTQKQPEGLVEDDSLVALKNPIPDSIPMSDLVVNLELVTQIPPSSDKMPRTRIAKLEHLPGKDDLFIVDLEGTLYKLEHGKPVVYMDMAKLMPKFITKPGRATGFGSFAFHPEFEKNGLLYTTHTEAPGSGQADFSYPDSIKVTVQWVLTEWQTKTPAGVPFSGKGRELFRANMVTGIHGVQEITFNPLAKRGDEDYGLLYIGIGDGGSAESGYVFLTRSKEKIWGSIIRIDPMGRNSANGKYGIPKSNPFSKDDNPNVLKEIYANGFRNPHRITWSKSGQILASNIGHNNIEALNIILPGHDYGWPIREGTFIMNPYGKMSKIYALAPDDSINHITYPVAQYDHDEGKAITGGFEYWGSAVPELKGKYIFGDLNNGRLFYVEMKDLRLGSQAPIKEWQAVFNGKRQTMAQLCGEDWVHLRVGRDNQGEIYVFTKPDGKVYRLSSVVNL